MQSYYLIPFKQEGSHELFKTGICDIQVRLTKQTTRSTATADLLVVR